MKNHLIAATLLLGTVAMSCWAQEVPDPLHGYCAPAATQCIDNGTNSPTTANSPNNFGFTVSPGPASGDLFLDILTPNNEAHGPSYAITGTLPGTATLFSATAWTGGDLDTYLGISASPNNPIGAYLPSTKLLDPSATGFFVYQVDLGATTLQGPSNPNLSPLENISGGIPLASYLVGFLNEGTACSPDWIATANSGAIFETSAPPVPEPSSIVLLGSVMFGLGIWMKRRTHERT
jgi:PEP-CTERM motif